MDNQLLDFIQKNSPDGGFLQSEDWINFQEAWGRKAHTIAISDEKGEPVAQANVLEHKLPLAGKYFYVPRGPVIQIFNFQFSIFKQFLNDLILNAQKNNAGWVRIEPANEEMLNLVRENLPKGVRMKKSPVDMQPKEILMLDISRSEEEVLAGMKQKARYNIRLAEKKGVHVTCNTQHVTKENIEKFLRLVKITSERDKITSHPEGYYRKMFEAIPPEVLKLYVAEYGGKIIAANLVVFFGKTATYLHGASDNEHRNAMAPYLLQWRQIQDAKNAGCIRYDFGGIKTGGENNAWSGITKFKQGFAPSIQPIRFPGSYDIVVNPRKYLLYRTLRKIKP